MHCTMGSTWHHQCDDRWNVRWVCQCMWRCMKARFVIETFTMSTHITAFICFYLTFLRGSVHSFYRDSIFVGQSFYIPGGGRHRRHPHHFISINQWQDPLPDMDRGIIYIHIFVCTSTQQIDKFLTKSSIHLTKALSRCRVSHDSWPHGPSTERRMWLGSTSHSKRSTSESARRVGADDSWVGRGQAHYTSIIHVGWQQCLKRVMISILDSTSRWWMRKYFRVGGWSISCHKPSKSKCLLA